jgi:hypothetical protein
MIGIGLRLGVQVAGVSLNPHPGSDILVEDLTVLLQETSSEEDSITQEGE